jgi:hypothetical protein
VHLGDNSAMSAVEIELRNINYVLYFGIHLGNIGISMYYYTLHRQRSSYLLIVATCMLMMVGGIFELLQYTEHPTDHTLLLFEVLGTVFNRVAMLVYMVLVLSRLYSIRFRWQLGMAHFAVLYTLTTMGWLASIITYSMFSVGKFLPEYYEWTRIFDAGAAVSYISYAILILVTATTGYTVTRILFSRRSDVDREKSLQRQRKLYRLFFLSNTMYVLSLLFWVLGDYAAYEDKAANWVLWIISYSTTAGHFTFEVFFQHSLSYLLEKMSTISNGRPQGIQTVSTVVASQTAY